MSASVEPLYAPDDNVSPAFCLRYSWASWPKNSFFENLCGAEVLAGASPLWEQDGLRLLEHQWTSSKIQLTFSTTPEVSPELLASRAKGRLKHALRSAGCPQAFSRKLAVRSVGDNTTDQVNAYIANQVGAQQFVDPKFEERIKEFTVISPMVDLSAASESGRGRYWYNLHLVLQVAECVKKMDMRQMETVRDGCFRIAERKKHGIARLSVMIDHLHLAMRGRPGESPKQIAQCYQNNLAYMLGQYAVWRATFYVGTFGEYDMGGIRNCSCPT